MKLGEILDIKAGTLIKGIRMVSDPLTTPSSSGRPSVEYREIYLSLTGWTINGISLPEYTKDKIDDTQLFATLTLMPRHGIKDIEGKHTKFSSIKTIDEITVRKLSENSLLFRHIFLDKHDFYGIREGEIVGMSLGETLVSFVPKYPDIYRKDYYQLLCWHKVLLREKVCWIRMTSKTKVNSSSIIDVRKNASEAPMEIL